MKRHLFYHVFPVKGSIWRWHARQLSRYLEVFGGKKIIRVAIGHGTDSFDAVKREFGSRGIRFIRTRNDPALGEAKDFIRTLGLFASSDPDEAVFYAHAKGVTRWGRELVNIAAWSEAMYYLNLTNASLVDRLLRRYPTVGCFRQVMRHGGAPWHYSGSFFWMRSSALFSRDWRACDVAGSGRYAVEGYPGRLFSLGESFALTPQVGYRRLYEGRPLRRADSRGWLSACVASP